MAPAPLADAKGLLDKLKTAVSKQDWGSAKGALTQLKVWRLTSACRQCPLLPVARLLTNSPAPLPAAQANPASRGAA